MANSNKHVNEPLRRQYAIENAYCELWPLLYRHNVVVESQTALGKVPAQYLEGKQYATETHHIFTNPRLDAVTNLIRLCGASHRWCHKHLDASRVCCLYVKWRKGELDVPEIDELRRRPLVGWLELLAFEGELAWVEPLRVELLKGVKHEREQETVGRDSATDGSVVRGKPALP